MSQTDFPLPPPTFEFLIFSLKVQAEMRMGLLSIGPESAEPPNLAAARHAIDMLVMVSEKTRGNLELDEQRMLENTITELRFRFVQVSDDLQKKGAAPDAPPADEAADRGAESSS